jgi:hypothetical protein
MERAREHGLRCFRAEAPGCRGWALAAQGQGQEGMAQSRQGLASWRATGAEITWTYDLTRLAEAYGKAGPVDPGLPGLTAALPSLDHRGARRWAAELSRLKGPLTRHQGQVSRATGHKVGRPTPEVWRRRRTRRL